MAWVRIHDAALTHPKMTGLVTLSHPFTLWVWGLTYCQTHLTDGAIPKGAVPASSKRAIEALITKGLWESSPDGFRVHDYLEWNDSREAVTKKRTALKERVTRHRERVTNASTTSGLVITSTSKYPDPEGVQGKPSGLIADEDLGDRARQLIERYQELFYQHRRGARCPIKPALDFPKALELVATWPDNARLEKLAVLVLTTDDDWIARSGRSFAVFAAKAGWADDKLREWEETHGVMA